MSDLTWSQRSLQADVSFDFSCSVVSPPLWARYFLFLLLHNMGNFLHVFQVGCGFYVDRVAGRRRHHRGPGRAVRFSQANEGMDDLRMGKVQGAAVGSCLRKLNPVRTRNQGVGLESESVAAVSDRSRKCRKFMTSSISVTSFLLVGCSTRVCPLRVTLRLPLCSLSTSHISSRSA